MAPPPRVLVSACLLGEAVRYDGGHKRSQACLALGRAFELVSLCPEVELGMSVPREPIDLRFVGGRLRLMGRGGRDRSEAFARWAEERLTSLAPLHGALLKAKSPSCGIEVPHAGAAPPRGPGAWVQALRGAFPGLPCLDEVACEAAWRRAAFRARVAARARLERAPEAALSGLQAELGPLLRACGGGEPPEDPLELRAWALATLGEAPSRAAWEATLLQ